MHALLHIDHQHRRFDRTAWLVLELYPHRLGRAAAVGVFTADAQPQAATAQRAMHPGERRGVVLGDGVGGHRAIGVGRQRQTGEQLLALRRVGGVQPAGIHAAMRRVAQRVQCPAGATQRMGVAADRSGFGRLAQPDGGRGWRQVAKRIGVAGNPAGVFQSVAGGQDVGACGVHAQTSSASAVRVNPVRSIWRASSRSPVSAMQPWSSRSTASGCSDSIRCR